MNDFNVGSSWSINDLARPAVKKWIRVPVSESFSPSAMAWRCNDESSLGCPFDILEGHGFVQCPFGKECTQVTTEDWEALLETKVSRGVLLAGLSRYLKKQH